MRVSTWIWQRADANVSTPHSLCGHALHRRRILLCVMMGFRALLSLVRLCGSVGRCLHVCCSFVRVRGQSLLLLMPPSPRGRVSTYGPSGAGRGHRRSASPATPVRPGANVRPWWAEQVVRVDFLWGRFGIGPDVLHFLFFILFFQAMANVKKLKQSGPMPRDDSIDATRKRGGEF